MPGVTPAPRSTVVRFVGLAVLWGSNYSLIKVSLEGLTPGQLVLGRLMLGAFVLLVIAAVRKVGLPTSAAVWGHVAAAALLGNVIPFLLLSYGEQGTGSGIAAVLTGTTPLITLMIAAVALPAERATARKTLGLLIGLLGVVLVVGPWTISLGSLGSRAACFGAAVSYAACFVYARKFLSPSPRGLPPLALAAAQLTTATALQGIAIPFLAWHTVHFSDRSAVSILCLGLSTGVAYILFFRLIADLGATTTSAVNYLAPIFALLIGALLLGEPVRWNLAVGGLVVLAGVAYAENRFPQPLSRARRHIGRRVPPPHAASTSIPALTISPGSGSRRATPPQTVRSPVPGRPPNPGASVATSRELSGPGQEGGRIQERSPGWSWRRWVMLVLLCGVLVLVALDTTTIGVAIPPMKAELHMTTAAAQWVISAYLLGFGGFLLLGGQLTGLIGRRTMLLSGVAVLAVASLVGGLADTGLQVIVARFVMGVAAAAIAPAGLAIMVTASPPGAARNKAVRIYASCGAAGFAIGLVVFGLLTQVSWRLAFYLPVLVAVLVLADAARLVPKGTPPATRRRPDLYGTHCLTLATFLLIDTIVQAPILGWTSAPGFCVAALLLGAFAWNGSQTWARKKPLIALGFLRNGTLIGAVLAAAATLGTYVAFQFIAALYLQSLRGWSPIEMALALLPGGILTGLITTRAGALLARVGSRWMTFAGFGAFTAASVLFLRVGAHSGYVVCILPSVLLIGVALPLAFGGSYTQAVRGVAGAGQGLAAGVLQTGYQLGGAVVLAIVTDAMVGHRAASDVAATLAGYHRGMWVIAGIAGFACVCALAAALRDTVRRRAGRAGGWPSPIRPAPAGGEREER